MSPAVSIWLSGLPVALALVVVVWLVSLARRDASIIDVFWGPGFVVLAWFHAASSDGWHARRSLTLALVTLWGLRLAAHILWRSRGRGEDYRYAAMRRRHGARFPWISLVTVFLLQGLLLWLISAPLAQSLGSGRPRAWTAFDLVALALFVVGFLFEAIGDWQLARFRSDPGNRGRVLRRGLWRYTRHPNYFGDAVVWWSFFSLALATPASLWTVLGPLLMTFLLLEVSGVGMLEKKLKATRPEYEEYVASTSAFVPWFSRSDASTGERS